MPNQSDTRQRQSRVARLPFLTLAAALGLALTGALLSPLGTAQARPITAPPALMTAGTITVTTTTDSGPGSLRDALVQAADGDTVEFNLPADSAITVSAELTVTAAITIDGTTADNLTLSGGGVTRVFSVTAPLHLLGLTVSEAAAAGSGGGLYSTTDITLTAVTFQSNATVDGRGGGLFTLGVLFATASNFLSNTVTAINIALPINRGGGAYAEAGVVMTGGLFLNNRLVGVASVGGLGTSNNAILTNTQFVSNTAGDAAGGLRVVGQATLTNVEFRANTAGSVAGGLLVNGAATLSGVVFIGNQAGTDAGAARFSGAVTLLGGRFEGNSANGNGGGLSAGVGLVFSGTTFLTNMAVTNGGGLYVVGGPLVGAGGVLQGNVAGADGGGLITFDGVQLSDTQLLNNSAGGQGGGLITYSGAQLTGTQLLNNSAAGDGGGLELSSGDARLVNVLAANNTAGGVGAGLHLTSTGEVTLLHLTIAAATANPRAAVTVEAGTVTLSNTILAEHAIGLQLLGGAATADYILFYNTPVTATAGVALGANLRSANPIFVDAAAGDFHLGLGSAATNAGADVGVLTDLDGASRPVGSASDLGAYERQLVDYVLSLPLLLR